ncbi:MAG: SCO family protein [Pseudomonadota bacterium]
MTPIARTVGLCSIFIAAVVGMFVYSVTRTPELSDAELREKGVFLLPTPRELTAFSLPAHDGGDFDLAALQGKWSFLFFGFTHCPDICPTSMSELGQVERELQQAYPELAERFQGVLITVDPERDTLDLVGRYAQAFSPRFVGVSSDRDSTAAFASQVNAVFAKMPDGDGGYTMDHTGNLVIINPYGHYHGFIKLPHTAETIRLAYLSLAARI